MNAEPSGWHSFGEPSAGAARVETAPAGPAPGSALATRPLSAAASHRNAWLAVGATILAAVAALAVFIATVVVSGGAKDRNSVVVASRSEPSARGTAGAQPSTATTSTGPSQVLLVDVEGAVRAPGLHQVPAGSRVGDAIAAAGGYADRADLATAALTLNLAEPLTDGAKIRVPLLGENGGRVIDGLLAPSPAPTKDAGGAGSGLIDLNHADQPALESLPGIGPVTAAKIIATRESGPFASLDDVVERKALSASVLDKIRSLVTVTP